MLQCAPFDTFFISRCVASKMVRNRKRKTEIGLHDANNMKKAIELVEKAMPLRKAAERRNVNYSTLHRYVKKQGLFSRRRCRSEIDSELRSE